MKQVTNSSKAFVLMAFFLITACGCDTSAQRDYKRYEYPSGGLKLLEEYDGNALRKSTWYDPDGAVLRTTEWTLTGDGISYQVEDAGWISIEAPMKNNFAHGTTKYFDEKGNVIATREFREGVATSEKIPVDRDDEEPAD